jgi:DNA-nicking Smr family endonuclease
MVQSVLEKHPLVERFHDAAESHLGATVAVLID